MPRFFIDRPIFAWVIALFILVMGSVSVKLLPVAQYPTVAPPSISVSAFYPGASAQTLEETVLSVIEQEMNGSPGLIYMESVAQANGSGQITITFETGTDPALAQVDVQNRLSRAAPRLPAAVTQQGVRVDKARSNFLLFTILSSSDPKVDPVALGDYASRNVVPEIQRIAGVGQALLFGTERAMRIWIDPAKLVGYGLSASDVNNAIRGQNAQVSSGSMGDLPIVQGQQISATVVVNGQLDNVDEFGDIVLRANTDGSTVRLRDVARIELGGQNYATSARLNGNPSTGIGVQLSPTGNALATATAVHQRMTELSRYFPPGMKYDIPYDSSRFIRISISQVVETLLEAMALVFLVMFLFLQSFRFTLIPAIVVPVALMGSFTLMFALGYTINVLTMFAMVLAVGILVDDAIVVIENVERIMSEEGLPPREATRKAMGQITAAIIGITVTLAAVFIPMAFFAGSVGNIYRQFSLVMVSSMMFSAFLAMSLTPALCATLLKPVRGRAPPREARLLRLVQPRFQAHHARVRRWRRLGAQTGGPHDGGVRAAGGAGGVDVPAAAGVVLAQRGSGLPDRQRAAAAWRHAGAHAGGDAAGRGLHAQAARSAEHGCCDGLQLLGPGPERGPGIRAAEGLERAQGRRAFVAGAGRPCIRRADGRARRVHLRAGAAVDPRTGYRHGLQLSAAGSRRQRPRGAAGGAQPDAGHGRPEQDHHRRAARRPGRRAAAADRHRPRPRGCARRVVRRHQRRADHRARLGLRQRLSQQGAPAARGGAGRRAGAHAAGRPVEHQRDERAGQAGAAVGVCRTRWVVGAMQTVRYNGYPAMRLAGDAAHGYSTGEAMDEMERLATQLPPGFAFEWTGLSREEKLAGSQTTALIAFSLLAVFLALAALYESWSIPVSVMLVVPLGVLGAILGVTIRGMPNDVFFKVGLIAVIGLSSKNAILIIEFAKDLHAQGKGLIEATLEACHMRFRPILMTSIAFILGVTPLVVASSASAASQRAIGTGVMAGMISATVLAVFFVPAFFVFIRGIFKGSERQRRMYAHEIGGGAPAADVAAKE